MNKKEHTRKNINHEILNVVYKLELKNGNEIEIPAERHTLFEIDEVWDSGFDCWIEDPNGYKEEIDEFHLTKNGKKFLFDEEDFIKFFDVESYDCDSFSYGNNDYFDDEDNMDLRQEKFDNFIAKFQRIASKDDFSII